MARYKQTPMPPEQIMLFSTSVNDALAADSDVRSFNDVMECLDYSGIESKCSSLGCPPYPPKEMVKILTYAYSRGIRSSRKIEHRLKVDIEFIWLAGGIKPDHNTIARFRKDNWEHLADLFKSSVRVCMEAGLVSLSVVATDGTKIKSAGSARNIYGQKRLEREFAAVDKVLAEAEDVDAAEDEQYSTGDNQIPEHLRDAKERRAHLREIADRLKKTNRSTAVDTEPDARVMRTSEGTRPAYNLQASVDAQSQIIVAMELIQHEVDTGELPEMIRQVQSNTGCSPDTVLADCGYSDEATFAWIAQCKPDILMPTREQHLERKRNNDPFSSKCFTADGEKDVLKCPAGKELRFTVEQFCGGATYRQYAATDCQSCPFYLQCVKTGHGSRRVNVRLTASVRNAMREKLATEQGKKLFALRSQSIEPVFGQMKSNRGLDRFVCWGLRGASAEAALACLAHNVQKCAVKAFLAASFCLVCRLRYATIRMSTPWAQIGTTKSLASESF